MNDHDRTQSLEDRPSNKMPQCVFSIIGAKPVQIDMRLHGIAAMVQPSKDLPADSRRSGLHVLGRIGDTIPRSRSHQLLQCLANMLFIVIQT